MTWTSIVEKWTRRVGSTRPSCRPAKPKQAKGVIFRSSSRIWMRVETRKAQLRAVIQPKLSGYFPLDKEWKTKVFDKDPKAWISSPCSRTCIKTKVCWVSGRVIGPPLSTRRAKRGSIISSSRQSRIKCSDLCGNRIRTWDFCRDHWGVLSAERCLWHLHIRLTSWEPNFSTTSNSIIWTASSRISRRNHWTRESFPQCKIWLEKKDSPNSPKASTSPGCARG